MMLLYLPYGNVIMLNRETILNVCWGWLCMRIYVHQAPFTLSSFFLFVDTVHYVALAVLDLIVYARPALNS